MKKTLKFLLSITAFAMVAGSGVALSNIPNIASPALAGDQNTKGVYLYFKPNSDWASAGASFQIHYWYGDGDEYLHMTKISGTDYWYGMSNQNHYDFNIERLDGSGSSYWGGRTANLYYDGFNNCFEVQGSGVTEGQNCSWFEKRAEVKFSANGGSGTTMTTQYIKQESTITLPSCTYTKTGYDCNQWTLGTTDYDVGASYKITFANIVGYETLDFKAKWVGKTSNVTLDPQGGTGGTESVVATYGSAMPSMTRPTKTGYSFNGYYTGTSGTGTKYYNANGSSAKNWDLTSATTLYAYWTINKYTLTAHANEGSIASTTGWTGTGNTATKSLNYNAEYGTLPSASRDGYTLDGWFTAQTGGTQVYSTTTMGASDTDIYAHWTRAEKPTYTITWKDGDNNTLKTDTVEEGTTPSYSGATPTKLPTVDHTYTWDNGWTPNIVPAVANATYTATFTENVRQYTITFKDGDGKTIQSSDWNYNSTPSYTGQTPTKTSTAQYSYTWTGGWDSAITPVTGAKTYTATFNSSGIPYTLTWDFAGGQTSSGESEYTHGQVPFGTTIVSPADPTKLGYTFAGWDKEVPTTMPAQNVTLTAQWTIPDGYYVKFFSSDDKDIIPMTYQGGTGYDSRYLAEGVEIKKNETFKVVYYSNGEITTYYGTTNMYGGSGGALYAEQLVSSGNPNYNFVGNITSGIFEINCYDQRDEKERVWIPEIVTYTITVKHGDNDPVSYNLIKEEGKSANKLVTSEDIQVYPGDILAVYNCGSLQTMTATQSANNNCKDVNGVTTVVCEMLDKIYVDTTAKTIFCHGFEYGFFYMVITHLEAPIEYIKLKYNENPQSDCNEYFTESAQQFITGDLISFVNAANGGNNAVPFDVKDVDEASLSGNFETRGTKIICTGDVDSFAYLKLGKDDKQGQNTVYFGNVDIEAAVKFANAFLKAMEEVCDPNGYTGVSTLIAKWNEQAEAFNDDDFIEKGGQPLITNATISSPYEALRNFASSYDYIYSKYETSLDDFANRFPLDGSGVGVRTAAPLVPYSGIFTDFTDGSSSNPTLIIVIASLVTGLAIGGYFLLRRKKEE